jgi:cob(I)alamin adenosyltransferase|tara:strand:- start:288 stop:833 length:546 start_codon:yes stop_codon:yes gene_type:complete
MKIYTKTGDDGSTGLFFGGRVAKDSMRPTAYGAVDEAQAALGLARVTATNETLNKILVGLCRDLYVAMAELATSEENQSKLEPGKTLVTSQMVDSLDHLIDEISLRFEPLKDFVIPGQNEAAARLDWARVVIRRAERESLPVHSETSYVGAYLNRLSDLAWVLARWQEDETLKSKSVRESS